MTQMMASCCIVWLKKKIKMYLVKEQVWKITFAAVCRCEQHS